MYDIFVDCINNNKFREIVHTDEYMQMTYMSLEPLGEIERETHANASQFIQVMQGEIHVEIDGQTHQSLLAGSGVFIPPNTPHYVKNYSDKYPAKIVSIYAPPQH